MKAMNCLVLITVFASSAFGANTEYCKAAMASVTNGEKWKDAIPHVMLTKHKLGFSKPPVMAGDLEWVSHSKDEKSTLHLNRPTGGKNPSTGQPSMETSSSIAIEKMNSDEVTYRATIRSKSLRKMPEGMSDEAMKRIEHAFSQTGEVTMQFQDGICVPVTVQGAAINDCTKALRKISYRPDKGRQDWPSECERFAAVKGLWADRSLNLLAAETPSLNGTSGSPSQDAGTK